MSTSTAQSVRTALGDPEPPREGEDRRRWRTVYRGRNIPRQVGAVVELELTAEQEAWLDTLASEQGLTLVEAVSRALDLARTHDTA